MKNEVTGVNKLFTYMILIGLSFSLTVRAQEMGEIFDSSNAVKLHLDIGCRIATKLEGDYIKLATGRLQEILRILNKTLGEDGIKHLQDLTAKHFELAKRGNTAKADLLQLEKSIPEGGFKNPEEAKLAGYTLKLSQLNSELRKL
jgi:hypothetical protein